MSEQTTSPPENLSPPLKSHDLITLRVARNNSQTPDSMARILAALPKLKTQVWHSLLKKNETISLEIISSAQTVSFSVYLPIRLKKYIIGLFEAAYPHVLITESEVDFALVFQNTPKSISYTSIARAPRPDYLPFLTYVDFTETDTLAALMSILTSLKETEHAIVQWVINPKDDSWKTKADRQYHSRSETHILGPQIEHKLKSDTLSAQVRIGVIAESSSQAQAIGMQLESALLSLNHAEGSNLRFYHHPLLTNNLKKEMALRSWHWFGRLTLSIFEMATFWHLPTKYLANLPNISWGKSMPGEPPETLPIVTKETPTEIKTQINVYARTRFKSKDVVYGIKKPDRRRHMYVIGKTGTGKSTLLANMAINDLKQNEGLCVIDPHGDLVETLLNFIPSRRINDTIYFDPADPERTVQLNLFEGETVAHRELIASGIVSVFKKLYSYSWGPRLEYILRNALLTLLKTENAKMSDIIELLTNKKYREKVVSKLDDPILVNYWKNEFDATNDRLRHDSIAPILNKVGQFVSSPLVRNVVNANKSSFSIEEVMNQGKILLVNLSQGKLGEDNAALLGAMLITKIQLATMGRVYIPEEDRRDFYLYVDEFQNFATESFVKILSEARKYRLNLILANQYIDQVPEVVRSAIFGNIGNMASFVMGASDAEIFAKEYGQLYTPDDLISLDRYQIINKLTINDITSKPFPAYTLPLAKSQNQNKDKVIRVSRERYAKMKK